MFLIFMAGLCGILGEFLRPGLIGPGVLGTAAVATAAYKFWHWSPTVSGLGCLGCAALLFAAEGLWNTRFVCGSAATAKLAYGFCHLFDKPNGIHPAVAIPGSVILGATAVTLLRLSKRARLNKRADL